MNADNILTRNIARGFILVSFAILTAVLVTPADAQPSDARIKKDLKITKGKTIRFTSKGSKRWEDLKYVWVRDAEIIRPANIPEFPDVKVLVWGTVVYDITHGKYTYSKFRVGYNSYLGIPNPTTEDVKAFLEKNGTKKLVGSWRYNNIVSDVSYKIADDPKWEWHTPKSVSFNVIATYDILSSVAKAVETVEQVFRVRLYADEIKGPWQNMLSSDKEKKVLSTRNVSPDEYNRLQREESLGMREAKSKADAALAALPAVTIPDFKSDVDLILYTHKMLREASPEELESYLMRVLAPGYFLEGSTVMLTQQGADIINRVVRLAHKLNITYGEAYCADPVVAHSQPGMMEFYSKATKGKTRIAVGKFGGTYREGVLVDQKWKIKDISLFIPNKANEIAYIRSFSDPNKLCPKAKPTVKITWNTINLSEVNAHVAFPDQQPKKTAREGKQFSYLLNHATGTYMVTAWKLGKTVSAGDAAKMIDNVTNNFVKNIKYNVTSKRLYRYKGNRGKDLTMQSGDNVIRYKIVVVGEILYQLVYSTTKQAINKEAENKFFGSFTVTGG
ncbi:MAG: hypothetical protein GXO82_05300 [Chlorobi bacterium]|nr:hypothetical protein [Chlorobiota bacterium]